MPDALARLGVLAWLQSKLSRAEAHSSAWACQVLSGNAIAACLLIAVSVLPPNRRLQRTRFAPRDRGDFRNRIRADCSLALEGAPLKRNTLGGGHQARLLQRSHQVLQYALRHPFHYECTGA